MSVTFSTQLDPQSATKKRLRFTPQSLNKPSDTISHRQAITLSRYPQHTHTCMLLCWGVCIGAWNEVQRRQSNPRGDGKPRPSDVTATQQTNGLRAMRSPSVCAPVSKSYCWTDTQRNHWGIPHRAEPVTSHRWQKLKISSGFCSNTRIASIIAWRRLETSWMREWKMSEITNESAFDSKHDYSEQRLG